jgi:hypothetical protein
MGVPTLFADAALDKRLLALSRFMYEDMAVAVRQAQPTVGEPFLDLGTTYALFAGEGSPLTQATGAFEPDHLEEIQRFYAGRVTSWEAVLTPFAGKQALQRALDLGAKVQGWEHTLYRTLDNLPEQDAPDDVEIIEVHEAQMAGWSSVSTKGFFGDQETDFSRTLSRIMELTPNVRRYLALWQGKPAAAATSIVRSGVAFLGGAATMPEFRKLGLQRALLVRRLHDAAESADLATVGTGPGTGSQRNVERVGFRIAYTQLSLRVPTQP